MEMLRLENISKRFGKNEVLKSVSLTVEQGEIIAILGSSGSGKSTLLRCINGLEEIDKGKVIIEGDVYFNKDEKHKRLTTKEKRAIGIKLGMVFQHFNLFPHKSVLQNVIEAPLILKRIPANKIKDHGMSILKKVGLEDKANSYPSKISGGQKQRVAIARALAMNPDIMLFDEPTSALDPELVGEVMNVISDLAKENMTMLIVTHEMKFAKETASRIIFMDEGKIIADMKSEEFFKGSKNTRIQNFIDHIS